ncbi:hypothetical protein [Caballeronia sp. LjRoot31]|uniref:hypothetical protein n=1 Tax=Caballeronia sp. LjRoot31 TaxID=3342324 RepID=UPI003ED121A7
MITKTMILAACSAVWIGGVHAQEIYLQGGTQGAGIGGAIGLGSNFGLHADFNAINLSHNFTVGGNRYDDDIHVRQGGLYLDFFPWSGLGFRMTGGVLFTDDKLSGVSTPSNGTYVFGGKHYPALPGDTATATAEYPTVMPYFGIGFGHQPLAKGFGFIADLGVAYGVPRTSYTLSPSLAQHAGPAFAQQIASTGAQELSDKARRYRWYPIIQIGVSYRF